MWDEARITYDTRDSVDIPRSGGLGLLLLKTVFTLVEHIALPDGNEWRLTKTLPTDGALLKNYYGTGHDSLDNYVAMVSGQSGNYEMNEDCSTFAPFQPTRRPAVMSVICCV